MEKQKATEHSSLTLEESSKYIKENQGVLQNVSENKQEQHRMEYNFMDGLLGCVKI